jgi:hypothetical protein
MNDIDNEILYTDPLTMKSRPAWLVEAVDQLLMKIRHKNVWEISEWAIRFWAKKNPVEYHKFINAQNEWKKGQKNEFASTKNHSLRQIVNIPSDISYILEKFASHKIDDYGRKKFWTEFAKKYKGFASGEKQ